MEMHNSNRSLTRSVLLLLLLSSGCNKSVELLLRNETGHPATARVGIGDAKETAAFEDVDFAGQDTVSYKNNVKQGKTVFVYAELPQGIRTRAVSFTVNNDIKKTVPLRLTGSSSNDASSLAGTMNGFDEFGKPNTYLFKDATNFCRTVLGSFRIYRGDSLRYIISPPTLQYIFQDYNYGVRSKRIESIFSRNYSAQLAASIPFVGNASTHFGMSEYAKFSWHIECAGAFEWEPPVGKSVGDLFFGLPSDELERITDLFLQDTTQTMRFYYQAFVIKKLTIESRQFKKATGEVDVSVPVYFGTSGAYQEGDSVTYHDELNDAITQTWAYDVTWMLKQAVRKRQLQEEKEKLLAQISQRSHALYTSLMASRVIDTAAIKNKRLRQLASSATSISTILDSLSSESSFAAVKMDSITVSPRKLDEEKPIEGTDK